MLLLLLLALPVRSLGRGRNCLPREPESCIKQAEASTRDVGGNLRTRVHVRWLRRRNMRGYGRGHWRRSATAFPLVHLPGDREHDGNGGVGGEGLRRRAIHGLGAGPSLHLVRRRLRRLLELRQMLKLRLQSLRLQLPTD